MRKKRWWKDRMGERKALHVGDDDLVGEGVHSFGGEILFGPGLEFSERCREDVADSDISAKEDAEVFGRVARLDGPWLGDQPLQLVFGYVSSRHQIGLRRGG